MVALRLGAGHVTLRLRVDDDLARYWHVVAHLFQHSGLAGPFEAFLVRAFWHTWLATAPRGEVAYARIYRRDRHRCASPVCSRTDVTPHHLRLRSHGGGGEDENVASLCVVCHLELLHGGRLAAAPPASHITWTPGRGRWLTVDGRVKRAA